MNKPLYSNVERPKLPVNTGPAVQTLPEPHTAPVKKGKGKLVLITLLVVLLLGAAFYLYNDYNKGQIEEAAQYGYEYARVEMIYASADCSNPVVITLTNDTHSVSEGFYSITCINQMAGNQNG